MKKVISELTKILNHSRRGWSVIPVGKDKKPKVKWSQYQKEPPTEARLKEWHQKWPKANWAVITGAVSGVVVVDIDPRHGGDKSVKELEAKHGALPQTVQVLSGGGGWHFYFRHPGFPVKNLTITPGVEIKGDVANITLPPSIHQNGNPYRWKNHPQKTPIAPMPEWLLGLTQGESSGAVSSSGTGEIIEGSRNQTLAKFAGFLRRQGFDEQKMLPVLQSINENACVPPLGDQEVTTIAKSVGKYPSENDSDASKAIGATETKWITAKELSEQEIEEVEWYWDGFIGRSMTTLFSSRPKVGKTTLLFFLLKAILEGKPFLQKKTNFTGKVLLVSEEAPSLLKRRIKQLGLNREDLLVLFRFKSPQWAGTVAQIERAINQEKVSIVIIDTLASFWNVGDENDAPRVVTALERVQSLMHKHNVALLLIHHLRKMPGDEGTAHRGSSALLAIVEVAIEMNRYIGKPRRILSAVSRYEETSQDQMVIELDGKDYKFLGTPEQFQYLEVKRQAFEILPEASEEAITVSQLRENYPDKKPSITMLKEVLLDLENEGQIEKLGNGVKNNPFRFRKKSIPTPLKASSASETKKKTKQGKKP